MVFVFMLSLLNMPVENACVNPSYSVTYDGNGFTDGEVPVDTNEYQEGDDVTAAEKGSLEKAHHTFSEWNDEPDGSGDSYSGVFPMPGHDLTLYAQWCEDDKYPVIYHGNGNSEGEAPVDDLSPYYEAEDVTVLDNGSLLKDYHTFSGWNTQADGLGINYNPGHVLQMPAEELNLFAQWVENDKYTVLYYGNGNTSGSAPIDENNPYYVHSSITVLGKSDLDKEHHEFIGWNTASDGSGVSYSPGDIFTLEANVGLYAQWKEDPSFSVSYNGNTNDSGTAPVDTKSPYYEGGEVEILGKNDLSKNNHAFNGWNTESDGSGVSYNPGDAFYMGNADVELFAQWKEDPSYSVTYIGNGNDYGSAPLDSLSPYYTGETVHVIGEGDLLKNNHSFAGWNTSSDGEGLQYSEGDSFIMASENITLYAQWDEDPSFEIIYDGNGHDEGDPPIDADNPYYVGEAVVVLGQNTMAKEHYEFNGWNTMPDGSGDSYAAGDAMEMTEGGVVLYARWLPVSYTVTYHEGMHGTLEGSGVNEGLYFGDMTPVAPVVITDYGYIFTGWSPEPTVTVEGNADYYAQYVSVDDTLSLEKATSYDGDEPLDIGDIVSYTFTITNYGNVIIKDINLSDQDIVFYTTPEPFDLAPGNSVVFTAIGYHLINESDALEGYFTNEARAEGITDELGVPTIATDSATVVVSRAIPSIILKKEALTDNIPAKAGDEITYVFTVTNNGSVTLYDVYVSDTIIGFTSTRVTLAPDEFHTWTLPDFYEITENDTFGDDIYNEATAFGWAYMATKPVTYTDDATVVLEEPDAAISIEKSADDYNVYAGQTVSYNMIVENTGNVTLYDVSLTDAFLGITESRSLLLPGESFSVSDTYTTTIDDVPGFENIAVAEGYVHDGGEMKVTDSARVTVTVRETPPPVPPDYWNPIIEVLISPDSNSVFTGDEVIFTMVVSNKGNTVLNDVIIINEDLGFAKTIPTLFVRGSEKYIVSRVMNDVGIYDFTVTADGTSPQGRTVSDTSSTTVRVNEILIPPVDPQPGNPPEQPVENPETGTIPFDLYSVTGLITLGAGIFALIKREKEAEEDEDYDM